jgi:excinuclease ABC subunit A
MVAFPLGVMTSVTGVSGSGKSSLWSGQVLPELVADHLGHQLEADEEESPISNTRRSKQLGGHIVSGMEQISASCASIKDRSGARRGRTWRRILVLFDYVRKIFADTKAARARKYDAGAVLIQRREGADARIARGRDFVFVELLFLPSVYAPCRGLSRLALQREDAGDHVSR